jgi:hypothetical protein
MSNKKKTEKSIAWEIFFEDYKDNELQERYDGFLKNLSLLKEKHNKLVEPINKNLKEKSDLEELLMMTVKMGHFDYEKDQIVENLSSLEEDIESLVKEIQELKEKIKRESDLIKKYEDTAEDRLFTHFKYLRMFDPEVPEWLVFREKWKKII